LPFEKTAFPQEGGLFFFFRENVDKKAEFFYFCA